MNVLGENRRFSVAILISCLPLVPITFFDLRVSQLVADSENVVGKFISDYGQLPGYILIFCALCFLFVAASSVIEKISYSPFLVIFVLITFANLVEYLNTVIAGFVLLLVAILATLISLRLKKNETVLQFSRITALLAVITPLFMVQTLKWLWGRTRFRDLSSDFSDFTLWFLPQGPTVHRSFPSGHAAMGWMLLPLVLLANSPKQLLIISKLVIFWGILVSAGRVVSGAHYLSDVYLSMLMSIWTFVILKIRLTRLPYSGRDYSGRAYSGRVSRHV